MRSYTILALASLFATAVPALAVTWNFDNLDYNNNSSSTGFTLGSRNYNPPPIGENFDYGGFTPSSTNSSAYASGVESTFTNRPNSGSVELSWQFNASDGGESAAFTFDLEPSPGVVASDLSFDIMVGSGSTPDSYGGYGYFQVATRDGSYGFNDTGFAQELANSGYATPADPGAGAWQHIDIPLSGVDATVRAVTFQDYVDQSDGRVVSGPETIYIDNVTLVVPEPASLSMLSLGALTMLKRRRSV